MFTFKICKTIITNQHLLQKPDFNKTFNLTIDAGNVAVGTILPYSPIDKDLPLAYATLTLNDSETAISVVEGE